MMAIETHVVVLPFPAFGHMMPLYQLSVALAKDGVHVHYVSTPHNIARLPSPPPSVSNLVHFVSIPLPVLDACPLPVGAEATMDLPPEMLHYLAMSFDLLFQPVKEFVALLSPDWLIIDLLAHWAVRMGQELGVPIVGFSPLCAASMLFFGLPENLVGNNHKRVLRSTAESLMVPSPWVDFPSSVAYKNFEARAVLISVYQGENSIADRISKSLEGCEALAIRSCNEFEGEYLRALAKGLGKLVIPTGLLTPEPISFIDEKWIDTFHWLDNQKDKSITFVGFGSECRLKREEIQEIARGLELSQKPFLWSLRRPSSDNNDETDLFPPDFLKNTLKQGRVCFGWAPQVKILEHPSVGSLLFHSGWGTMIESIQFGHRLVVLPFVYDQSLNARLLVEKGIAIEVERGENGTFSGEGIAKALREASEFGDGGEGLTEAAIVASDQKLQKQYLDEFVMFLKQGVTDKKK